MQTLTADIPPGPAAEFAWLVRARWIAIAALGGFTLLAQFRHLVDTIWSLLGVVAVAAVYNAAFSLAPDLRTRPRAAARYGLFLDILTLTMILHFSGDVENPLSFAYAIPIVAGAILLSLRSAIGLALTATALFSALIVCTHFEFTPVHMKHHHLALLRSVALHEKLESDITGEGADYLVWSMVTFVAVQFGAAFGSGALSGLIRRQRAEIQSEVERTRLLLSILPEGAVLIGKGGAVVLCNETAKRLFPPLSGGTIQGLDPNLRLADILTQVDEEPIQFESRLGEQILEHALVRTSPDGPFLWVFHDITEQRRLMAQIIHQARMVDLGLLAAGIAHEIGNPLSSMAAVIEVIEMKHPPPEMAERLRSLRTHVDRIDRIVKDVTGFARPSGDLARTVDASALTAKALEIFRMHERSRGIAIEAPRPEAPARVHVVEDQIVQVLLNLLLNAVDASDGKGGIRVETRRAGREAEIVIVDHGTGISEETQRRLFTAFFTTKEPGKGVGLGLFVSESIVRTNGGRIRVDSAPGRGSTFVVCLPLVRDA